MAQVEQEARKYALNNAIAHGGKANPGAVIGQIMAKMPELRSDSASVIVVVKRIVGEVNALSQQDQKDELQKMAPELLEKKKQKKEAVLSDLPGNTSDGVVVRFAPGPSGPLHIGHTRAVFLNDEYIKRYGGKYIIRLEDTNPAKIDPEAYDTIFDDLDWLGISYTDKAVQSDRFDIYIQHMKQLIEGGHGYVCDCEVEKWRQDKDKKIACPHRDQDISEQLARWEKMHDGTYNEGDASAVVKTDISHPNPAVRDFVAFRIVDHPHPRTGDRFRIYPTYNLSVAVDDHLMGMTHVLRGKDHLNNTIRQQYVYRHLGWDEPEFTHYGWVSIEGTLLKTSQIREGILSGLYSGWDDVRLGTIQALAKRGFQPDSLRKYWIDVGTNEVDIKFSWSTLFAHNKEIIDPKSYRFFFVWDPIDLMIDGVSELDSSAPFLPDNPEAGARKEHLIGDGRIGVKITSDDAKQIPVGGKARLKDLCNVTVDDAGRSTYIGNDLAIIKQGAKIIHWAPIDSVPTKVMMPDGEVIDGVTERTALEYVNKVVQFERFGFVNLQKDDAGLIAYFTHK